jgi:hypothetical protein
VWEATSRAKTNSTVDTNRSHTPDDYSCKRHKPLRRPLQHHSTHADALDDSRQRRSSVSVAAQLGRPRHQSTATAFSLVTNEARAELHITAQR